MCVFQLNVTLSAAGGVPLISGLCDPHSQHWEINAILTQERGITMTAGARQHNVQLQYICSNDTLVELRGYLYREAADSIAEMWGSQIP